MAIEDFRLPDLGEGLEDGEIVEWQVAVGDEVKLNQPVVDIETAKAVVSVPSPFSGRVVELGGEVGQTLEVGAVLLKVETAGGASAETGREPQNLVGYGSSDGSGSRRARVITPDRPQTVRDRGPLAKPKVRKLARERGVDLDRIAPGSGPGGSITEQDVEAAAAAGPISGGDGEPVRGIRKRIMEKMELAHREIPPASASSHVDVTDLWALAESLTADRRAGQSGVAQHDSEQQAASGMPGRVTPFVLLMRATVLGLLAFPILNSRIVGRSNGDPGEIELLPHIHLGFAVDTPRGLVVPNIKDAQHASVSDLARGLEELTKQARDGSIRPGDVTNGTFTVNNYGSLRIDDAQPIVNHPETGIMGMGAARPRAWVVDDEITVRRIATLRLVFDHRVCDGGDAAQFVAYVAELCESPQRLVDD